MEKGKSRFIIYGAKVQFYEEVQLKNKNNPNHISKKMQPQKKKKVRIWNLTVPRFIYLLDSFFSVVAFFGWLRSEMISLKKKKQTNRHTLGQISTGCWKRVAPDALQSAGGGVGDGGVIHLESPRMFGSALRHQGQRGHQRAQLDLRCVFG